MSTLGEQIRERFEAREKADRERDVEDAALRIPHFLDRRNQRGRLTDEELAVIIRPAGAQRQWVMPDRSAYDKPVDREAPACFIVDGTPQEFEIMGRLNEVIVNPEAPVQVFRYQSGGDPTKERLFPNLNAFEGYFTTSRHRSLGVNSQQTFTDVLLEITGADQTRAERRVPAARTPPGVEGGKTAPERPTAARAGASERPARPPSGPRKGGYVDKRHIALLAAAGFSLVPDSQPMAFSKGKLTVVIAPPPEGKAWSSSWTLPDGRGGRGIATLLAALKA